jgi:hypothetical protein
MKDWYEADSTWEPWAKDREQYAKAFVVEGRFHSGVHEDVVKDFRIATHIMASAWYHYPMYDEALRKLLGTIEMAIKLRAKELGIRVTKRTRLQELIDKLFPVDKGEQFNAQLHRLRDIRNRYAHPEHYSFGAIAIQPIMVPLVNTLNRVFLSDDQTAANQTYLKTMRDRVAELAASAFVLTWQGHHYVIKEAVLLDAHQINDKWVSLWAIYPVLDDAAEALTVDNCPTPIMVGLEDAAIIQGILVAMEQGTEKLVYLVPLSDSSYLNKVEEHIKAWESIDTMEKEMMDMVQRQVVWSKLNEFQYQHFWV